jgi:sterol desaturase/sphingolipid hydroxylase (fatty acid hydroxylase superfamily)
VPILWRIHRTHHTDLDFDVSTAIRFHPAEALVMTLAKVAAVAAIGAPVSAVIVYELAYPLTTFWVHANVRLPAGWDRAMRWLVLTPDMHRAHHSIVPHELNSNFGGLFSFWDRLFGTYTHEPAAGHLGMRIGLPSFQDHRHLNLDWMLRNPLLAEASAPDSENRAAFAPTRR